MIILPVALISLLALVGAAYVTNPFSRFTIIKQPFTVQVVLGAFRAINNNHKLRLRQQWWWRLFATLKCFIHILETRYVKSVRSRAATLDGIIADIHTRRFDPHKLLLTSGDHFSALFVRNLGVFYYPMCDRRITGTTVDWHNRQICYLQTLAYALGVFEKRPVPVTTIVTTGAYHATGVNFWRYPSDTVYGLLYALAALLGKERAAPSDYAPPVHDPNTVPAATILLSEYRETLTKLYTHYRSTVFDESSGLLRSGLLRSDLPVCGAKDITKRACSFYDNVVFWKTTELAMTLGLIPADRAFLKRLKQTIIHTFWLEKQGYFLEEPSEAGRTHAYYSSDWLIVLATGFLEPAKKSERHYFVRSIAYIQKAGVDRPFALKYQAETRGHKQFFLAKIAFASYQRDVVWSFWGMEYIKALLLLFRHTGDRTYLKTADFHLAAYKKAMVRDGGFPEVFDDQGKLYQTPLYRSVRQTGWVIGFEQARTMRAAIVKGAK